MNTSMTYRECIKKILEETSFDDCYPLEMDFSNPLHVQCVEKFFGGKTHMNKAYPEFYQLFLRSLNLKDSNPADNQYKGFCDAAYIFDVGYDQNESVAYALGNMNLTQPATRMYVTLDIYRGAELIGHNAVFSGGVISQDIESVSTPYTIPSGQIDSYQAVLHATWEDNGSNRLRSMITSSSKDMDLRGSSDEIVKTLTVDDPIHKVTPETENIMVSYARAASNVDYVYSETRASSGNEKVFLDMKGTVTLLDGYSYDSLKSIYVILKCDGFGDIFYRRVPTSSEIEVSSDRKSFTWALDNDWNNEIPDSVRFGNRKHSFDFQLNYLCKEDYLIHTIIVSSDDYPHLHNKNHYKRISYVQLFWGCIAEDAEVTMENGSKKLISQLQIGDNIRTEGGTVSTIMNVITGTEPTIYNLKSEEGSEIRATYDHPFLTDSGFVPVSKLDSQTRLKMMDGSFKRLLYCYPQEYNGRVYSLELNNSKTFYCNGFLSGTNDVQGDLEDEINKNRLEIHVDPSIKAECEAMMRDFNAEIIGV
jgi:hypothetical protein